MLLGAAANDALLARVDWIPLKRYLELYHDTKAAVRKRITIKAWKEGRQWSKPEGADIWISLNGVNAWAAGNVQEALDAPQEEEVQAVPALHLVHSAPLEGQHEGAAAVA